MRTIAESAQAYSSTSCSERSVPLLFLSKSAPTVWLIHLSVSLHLLFFTELSRFFPKPAWYWSSLIADLSPSGTESSAYLLPLNLWTVIPVSSALWLLVLPLIPLRSGCVILLLLWLSWFFAAGLDQVLWYLFALYLLWLWLNGHWAAQRRWMTDCGSVSNGSVFPSASAVCCATVNLG